MSEQSLLALNDELEEIQCKAVQLERPTDGHAANLLSAQPPPEQCQSVVTASSPTYRRLPSVSGSAAETGEHGGAEPAPDDQMNTSWGSFQVQPPAFRIRMPSATHACACACACVQGAQASPGSSVVGLSTAAAASDTLCQTTFVAGAASSTSSPSRTHVLSDDDETVAKVRLQQQQQQQQVVEVVEEEEEQEQEAGSSPPSQPRWDSTPAKKLRESAETLRVMSRLDSPNLRRPQTQAEGPPPAATAATDLDSSTLQAVKELFDSKIKEVQQRTAQEIAALLEHNRSIKTK
eukprot:COSAG01_NODE_1568_length_9874_cov_15.549872_2_plen_292_part_00